jgi:SAM-dependent methyltransferase
VAHNGPAFYDDDAIFSTYMARRRRPDNPNDLLEKPVIIELIGELTGLRILDLGCGDAGFGLEALAQDCQSYLGVEGSHNMAQAAQQNLMSTVGTVVQAIVEAWDYPTAAFDLVISRLVLHYIENVEAVFEKIHCSLVPGGQLIFSVEHPVITSSDRGWQASGPRQDWVVDDYFHGGQRITSWMGGQVVKYHRTIEDYFVGLQNAGFVVENLREATPRRERFADSDTFQRRQRIPLFLILAART